MNNDYHTITPQHLYKYLRLINCILKSLSYVFC